MLFHFLAIKSVKSGRVLFSDCFFGLNIEKTSALALKYPTMFFNSTNSVSDGLKAFTSSLVNSNYAPKVCLRSFVYRLQKSKFVKLNSAAQEENGQWSWQKEVKQSFPKLYFSKSVSQATIFPCVNIYPPVENSLVSSLICDDNKNVLVPSSPSKFSSTRSVTFGFVTSGSFIIILFLVKPFIDFLVGL
jgi:hypothetical protein